MITPSMRMSWICSANPNFQVWPVSVGAITSERHSCTENKPRQANNPR
jgi:hypothetical protein